MENNLIKYDIPEANERARSWFLVFNNPAEHIPECEDKTPEETVEYFCKVWTDKNGDNAACAFAYCVSAEGLHHIHGIAENPNKVAFKVVKELYPGIHLEATKGTKRQAEDYLFKRGGFAEKGEKIIYYKVIGEIAGSQGKRMDLEKIEDMVKSGMSLAQIQESLGAAYYKYEHIAKSYYFSSKQKELPRLRDIEVYWHTGASGSGKSYTYKSDPRGDDIVSLVLASNLSHPGCFDNYIGQTVLYIDELKPGSISYGKLIELIGGIKNNSICRYSTYTPLWTEVHITSVYSPLEFYQELVPLDRQRVDTGDQLFGRIAKTILHFATDKRNGDYIHSPRIRKQTDPENIQYHEIAFTGVPSEYKIDAEKKKFLKNLKSNSANPS